MGEARADAASMPPFPRVPAYAWTWLQRSRPVVAEAAIRLTGAAPTPGFVDLLREQFDTDPFVRDVLIGVVADVAFAGRAPSHRPPGASWDRGLTWWAAALAGVGPAEFEARARPPAPTQRALFDAPADGGAMLHAQEPVPRGRAGSPRDAVVWQSRERRALAGALRDLIASADGDQVPVSALRQLLAELEP